jgi:hypothetical protein
MPTVVGLAATPDVPAAPASERVATAPPSAAAAPR